MKKISKIKLLAGLFFLVLISCTNEYYTMENHDGAWVFSQEYNIGTQQYPWEYDNTDDLFYCDVYINELTPQIYDEGMIAGYFVYYIENQKVDSPLPFTKFYMDNKGYQWSHQYTCEFSPQKVTFIFKDSNYAVSTAPSCTFVVKMIR